jgi:hypothetical protein
MKITNREIANRARISEARFYYMKRHNPRIAELLIKGALSELLLPIDYFDNFIKQKGK